MDEILHHSIPPVYDQDSLILILGTFPSPKSREQGFYYGHPQNRFWRVLSTALAVDFPETLSERRELLLEKHIAMWDVLSSCSILGASDTSIRNALPNPVETLIESTKIHTVFTTGSKAFQLYQKLVFPKTKLPAIQLPSTSPANCRVPFIDLLQAYQSIDNALKEVNVYGKVPY